MNRPDPPADTGSASISGPHMAAQCRLPKNPSAMAIPNSISMKEFFNHG